MPILRIEGRIIHRDMLSKLEEFFHSKSVAVRFPILSDRQGGTRRNGKGGMHEHLKVNLY
jgi:hypothetical protein